MHSQTQTSPSRSGPTFGRRRLSTQARFADWRAADGWPLRTLRCLPEGKARGTVIFLNGRADFIEKYLESYADFLEWGYAVATLDWRGQGMSGRLGDHPHKGHQTDFDVLVRDLAGWIDHLMQELPRPCFLVGHSMGGHIALRYLAEHSGVVSRAVLLAPMLGIRTGRIPSPVTRRLARWMVSRGRAGEYAPTQRPYGVWSNSAIRQDALTADLDRFADEIWWVNQNPALALGGVTYGWLDAAFRSLEKLRAPGYLQSAKTPVLMLLAERELVVDPVAARHAASHLPACKVEVIPGGRHELLRDTNAVRAATLAHIRAALEEAETAAHG